MNAAGIRDMEAGQTLYWAVAIPITVVVVAVAFVYGYKGDEIGDWIHDKMHSAGGRYPRQRWTPMAEASGRHGALMPDRAGDMVKWPGDRTVVRGRWDMARHPIRYRIARRERKAEVQRRSTFQSDILP